MGTLFVLFVIAVFCMVIVIKGFCIIQQAETMVIERLGRYHRTLPSGINVIIPIIDRGRVIPWRYVETDVDGRVTRITQRPVYKIDLRETVYEFPNQNVITKDNVVTGVSAILYFQITDPVKAVYEIANLPDAIEKLTQTTLRNVIGELDLDQTLSSRDTINSRLRATLDDAADKWGVKVNRVELQDINPPEEIRGAMEKQMRAERDKRAAVLEAEGLKQAAILQSEGARSAEITRAEGLKQARILIAEGDAKARITVAESEAGAIAMVAKAFGGGRGDPSSYLVAMRYLESLKEMVSGKDNKVVYLPYEATAALGALGGIKEMFAHAQAGGPGDGARVALPVPALAEVEVACPKCGQHLTADAAAKGTTIACPACGGEVEIP
ncbi:MAG: SPFH domain-containing protein [Chthoniobacteraceae bacterium]|nr:SPFH domain-containing protein [Chthoniobacteraceae bacterium]